MLSTCYSYQILMKHEFSQQIFEKHSIIKFHKIHSVGAECFHVEGQIEGQT